MEALKDILPSPPPKVSKPLSYLALLPNTSEIEAELAQSRKALAHPYTLARLETRLADARLRDEITATRPEGCWCLGLGGRNEYYNRFGIMVFKELCPCPDGLVQKIRQDEAIASAYVQEERKRIDTLWANAQIPARFTDIRLNTSPLVKTEPDLITRLNRPHDIYADFPDADPPDSVADPYLGAMDAWWDASYFIYGPFGVGKTCLAVALARDRVEWEDGEWGDRVLSKVLFVSVPRMLSELRSTYNRSDDDAPTEQEVIDRYAKADLLILDDLGAEHIKSADWVGDRLYQIIGERHDELRPTIFTSNLTMDALAKRIGERITWRIVEMVGKANIIHLPGPNLRA